MNQTTKTFSKKMTRLEDSYLSDVEIAYASARRDLVSLLSTTSLNQGGFDRLVQARLNRLEREVLDIGVSYSGLIDEATVSFVDQQLNSLSGAPSLQRVVSASVGDRHAILIDTIKRSPEWVGVLNLQISAEIARLRSSSADINDAFNRLFAEEIADGRVSVWRSGLNSMKLSGQRNVWDAGNTLLVALYAAVATSMREEIYRQASAVVDERTTETCRNVNGQTVALDEPFTLYGSPRFANRMMNPPFHWNCRTTAILFKPEL